MLSSLENIQRGVASENRPSSLCLAVTQKHKIVSGSYDNSIRVLVMKGECLNVLYGHAGAIYSLCVLSTGVLVNGSVDTTIKLWDLDTGEIIETLEEHKESVMSLCAMSEKGQFASGSLDNSIRIWSVAPSSTLYVCTKILPLLLPLLLLLLQFSSQYVIDFQKCCHLRSHLLPGD